MFFCVQSFNKFFVVSEEKWIAWPIDSWNSPAVRLYCPPVTWMADGQLPLTRELWKKRGVLPSEKIEKRKNSNKSVPHHFSLAASFPYFDSLKFTNDERWIERAEKIHSLHQTPPVMGGGVKYTDEQHDPYHPVCLWRAELKQKIKITFLVSRENP